MSKKNIKNATYQQGKTKNSKTLPSSSKQHHDLISSDSEINFLVNVSSSGTNLNKRIEQEMSKLNQVEKKIRNHKSKTTAIANSAKSPLCIGQNHRKLTQILENMLKSMDLSYKRKNISSVDRQKRIDTSCSGSSKTMENETRSISNTVTVDSLTAINKRKKLVKINKAPKKDSTNKKPKMKKPCSARKCPTIVKLVENSNHEKSEIVPVTSVDGIRADSTEIGRTSKESDIVSKNFEPLPLSTSDDVNEIFCSEKNRLISEMPSKYVELSTEEPNEKIHVKPERKTYYSFLKKGNFTLTQHSEISDVDNNKQNEKYSEMNKATTSETLQNVEVCYDIFKRNTQTVSVSCDNMKRVSSSGVQSDEYSEIAMFPTELLERSITAVENVLKTIDSMTNEIEIQNEINDPLLGKTTFDIMDQSLMKIPGSNSEHIKATLTSSGVDRNKIVDRNDDGSVMAFEESKLDVLQVETHQTKGIENISSTLDKIEKRINRHSTRNILCLKSPIGSFYESDVSMPFSKGFLSTSTLNNSVRSDETEDVEPLKRALNSLRTRVDAIRAQVVDISPDKCISRPRSAPTRAISINKYPDFSRKSQFVNDSYAKKLLVDNRIYSSFTTNSFCESCSSRLNSASVLSCSSCECYDRLPPKKMYYRRSSKKYIKRRSEVFPEQNLQKCLILLKKNFRDFEISRQKHLERNITLSKVKCDRTISNAGSSGAESKKTNKSSDWLHSNKNYEVCFRNEKFKNLSETSLESRSRITEGEVEINSIAPAF